MARQELTFDQVAAAAAGLQQDGDAVTVEAVCGVLGDTSPNAAYRHLALWRAHHAAPSEPPPAELPPALLAGLRDWAQQYAQEAGAATRAAAAESESDLELLREAGEALEAEREELRGRLDSESAARAELEAAVTERDEIIERLNTELSDARQVAMDALVSKAKDQLAIDGKENQLAALRAQIERNVAAQAAESDARLAAEMELVGATTARDKFAAEVKELRAQVAALRTRR